VIGAGLMRIDSYDAWYARFYFPATRRDASIENTGVSDLVSWS
jgi:hypothetical protein